MNKWDKYRVYMHYYITNIAICLQFRKHTARLNIASYEYFEENMFDDWLWKFEDEIFNDKKINHG